LSPQQIATAPRTVEIAARIDQQRAMIVEQIGAQTDPRRVMTVERIGAQIAGQTDL